MRNMSWVVIILFGVIIADLVTHAEGTKNLFNGMGSIWQASINGMLGQPSTGSNQSGFVYA